MNKIVGKKILLAATFLFSFILSFPFVIPGNSEPVALHTIFGKYLVFLVMPAFLLFVDSFKGRKAVVFGWLLAVMGNFGVFYWIYYAVHVFGNLSAGISALLLLVMIVALGAFWALAAAIYLYLKRKGSYSPLLFASIWCVIEASRNFFPVNFFWAALGHSQYSNPFTIQFSAIGSTYILSFFIVWASLLALSSFKGGKRKWETVSFLVFFLGLSLYAGWKYISFKDVQPEKTVRVGILQPNINQYDVNRKNLTYAGIRNRFRNLINEMDDDIDLLIWPEASFPIRLYKGSKDFKRIWEKYFPETKLFKHQLIGVDLVDNRRKVYHNSAAFVADGVIEKTYDKVELVPFGEYLPWGNTLQAMGLSIIVPNAVGGFSAGHEYTVYDYGDFTAAPLICFDGVFSENTRSFVERGADLLVSITNDAWFGLSSAAFQHLSFYSMRSVETGRSIVRSANIGVSGVFLPDGTVRDTTPLFKTVGKVVSVPIYKIDTPYLRYGNWFIYLLTVFSVVSLLRIRFVENRKS